MGGDYIEVKKFEPVNYLSCGSDVYFNVNWEFVWKPTGKVVCTMAIVRKKLTQPNFGSKCICEKYHLINPADVKRAQKSFVRVLVVCRQFHSTRPTRQYVYRRDRQNNSSFILEWHRITTTTAFELPYSLTSPCNTT